MTLKEWLKAKKMLGKDFARLAGLSEAIVSRVRRGHVPKLAAARAIERATKGEVRL